MWRANCYSQRRFSLEDQVVGVEFRLDYDGSAMRDFPVLFVHLVETSPLDEPADRHYGMIRSELERTGRSIGHNDLLIAAHARALGAVLVTNNTKEFSRVAGLEIEDWR